MRFPAQQDSLAAAILLALTAVACSGDSNPVAPGDVANVLTEQLETTAFVFRFPAGDSVDSAWQQQYHDWATARLGVSVAGKIRYNKYRDNAQMNAVAGRGCCFAEPATLTLHTLWPRDNHEVVHIYANRIGSPTNFLSEGLAVAFQVDPTSADLTPRWNGIPLHDHARAFRTGGQLAVVSAGRLVCLVPDRNLRPRRLPGAVLRRKPRRFGLEDTLPLPVGFRFHHRTSGIRMARPA